MERTRTAKERRIRVVSLRQALTELHGQVLDAVAVMRILCEKPELQRHHDLTEAARDRLRRAENMAEAIERGCPRRPTPDSELPFDVPEWPFSVAW